ncbi:MULTISPECIES: zonular occludens toxin domain-containing protein [Stenotrophomonas]|uniref:zonular occludens toxin domain-containing protein n=1 Tax=Stenotrophomonas TaxID=40323 RepID=UPI00077055C1|nr:MULTISPECIES: zonular occludens toxin domain-containing protein [Stenotrophomonas]AMJ56653.1 zonular occludens toxin [Stenotrophomonas sp. KCTC 12332]
MIGDTASISLLTGLPGSGKSLRMTQRIVELVEKGEHVYTCNINGISVPGVTPWDDPTRWRDLPAGAVLFVDEAQQYFRARRGGDPPEYISAMETIRHVGVRLVLATQQPNYLDTHLRGLVGFHEHLLRQSGKDETFIFRNHQVMDEVRMGLKRIKGLYDHEKWKLPQKYFQYYKSAELHTVKYRMPALLKKVLITGPIAILLAASVFGWLFWKGIRGQAEAEEMAATAPVAQPGQSSASAVRSDGERPAPRTGEQYIAALTPMVADVPWSAPAYVDRAVVSDPHVYCMASENSCRCVTEQSTRVVLRDDVCRDIARWGEPYNPYKQPAQPPQGGPVPYGAGDAQPTHLSQAGAPSSVVGYSSGSRGDVFPKNPARTIGGYTPPTSTL